MVLSVSKVSTPSTKTKMMSWLWNALIRNAERVALSAFTHPLFFMRTPTMTHLDGLRRDMTERRMDATTADMVQVGICFMHVFGRNNAEAYFHCTDIEPAVYRRVIAGRFRLTSSGRGPEAEPVPA
jgi:hypothetical protein